MRYWRTVSGFVILMLIFAAGILVLEVVDANVPIQGVVLAYFLAAFLGSIVVAALNARAGVRARIPHHVPPGVATSSLYALAIQIISGALAFIAMLALVVLIGSLIFLATMLWQLLFGSPAAVSGAEAPMTVFNRMRQIPLPMELQMVVLFVVGQALFTLPYGYVLGRLGPGLAASIAARRFQLSTIWNWTSPIAFRASGLLFVTQFAATMAAVLASSALASAVGWAPLSEGRAELVQGLLATLISFLLPLGLFAAASVVLWRHLADEDHLAEASWKPE